jgi:hypothetical protein
MIPPKSFPRRVADSKSIKCDTMQLFGAVLSALSFFTLPCNSYKRITSSSFSSLHNCQSYPTSKGLAFKSMPASPSSRAQHDSCICRLAFSKSTVRLAMFYLGCTRQTHKFGIRKA